MKDDLPIRIGGIAADLARIVSFSQNPKSAPVVESLLDESRYFIEWTAPHLLSDRIDDAVLLLDIQLGLTIWYHNWHQVQSDVQKLHELAAQAQAWSDEVLKMSGFLAQE